jgi:sugar phosphate permease
MGASLGFIGVAPCVVLVSSWFKTNRGTALGLTLVGTSLGGTIIPLVAQPMITNYGWRNAMLTISAIVWLVLLPLILFVVKEKSAAASEAIDTSSDGMKWTEALRTPIFWALAACSALVFYPIFVTSQQFILYLQSPRLGVSAETAAFAQSALFAISIGGKFIAGFLSDRLGAIKVMVFCAGLMFAASLVLLGLTASNALFFLLPFALGYGGTFVLIQRLTSDLFGRLEAGKILGTITLIEVIGAAIGGRITGYLADQNGGDYTTAFYGVTITAGSAFVATVLILLMHRSKESQTDLR